MAKVRARKETGTLYFDFFYRGVRCREQTALEDTAANRKRAQTLLNRVEKEIRQGLFDYAAVFPGSTRAEIFATQLPGEETGSGHAPGSQHATARATVPAPPTTPTFTEFSKTWRAEMTPQWRRQHRNSVDVIFDAHLLPAFGERHLAMISKADVLAFRAELAKLPGRSGNEFLSPATINKTVGILRQCLSEASDRFGLPDVFRGIKRLRSRLPDIQPFTLEEVEKIRSTIRSDYRDYVTVRFFTGMRTGEINGLKWKYVDFDSNLILVRETFSAGVAENDAKTPTSLRDIPMLPMVKEALLQQWEARHEESEYVFCSREGNPVDAHNFANRVWYPLLRYLDLGKRRPYQTRHTAATLMLASGENPEWIAHVLGHSNTDMLFRRYSRYVPNLTRKDGLAFSGLLGSSPATNPHEALALSDMSRTELEAMVRSLKPGKNNNQEEHPHDH